MPLYGMSASSHQNPFFLDVPLPPHFRTLCELVENLEKAWKLFKHISIDPVFRYPSDDPLVDENLKDAIFLEQGSDYFTDICTKWATNEDLTYDIPRFFFDKLQAYVRKQCKALYAALERENDDVIIDVTLQKTKKYFSILCYLEEYFIYFESLQTQPAHDTEHDVHMSKIRYMMSCIYRDEVFSHLGLRLRRIALESLERYRAGDESLSHNITLFGLLIDLISTSKQFTEAEWDYILRENCFDDLARRERYLKQRCLCCFIQAVAKRVEEVEEFGVGATTLFTFRNNIFPMTRRFLFADKGRAVLHLVNAEAKIAMKKFCETFGYEQELMKKTANIIQKFMRKKVIADIITFVGENPSPMRVFTRTFFTWVKISVLCSESLDQSGFEKYIIEALTDPFTLLLSRYEQPLRETLLHYFCSRLIKSAEDARFFGKSPAEELEAAVTFLGRLPDVNEFLGTLMDELMKNLHRQEFSLRNVKYLLESLNEYFPHRPKVSELNGLLKIVTNQEKNLTEFSPQFSPWKQIPDPNPIPLHGVKAIQKVDWPQDCFEELKIPEAMEQAIISYSCFFHCRHGDKNFDYNFSYDQVTVTTSLFSQGPEEIDIHMTTHQMSILDLFQEHNSLMLSQIMKMIQYRNGEETHQNPATVPELVLKVLKSMMLEDYPLLKKTPESTMISMEDILSLNRQFVAPSRVIILPVP